VGAIPSSIVHTLREVSHMLGDRRRALTERQERSVCRSYEGGKSVKRIAKYYGVADSTVRGVLKRRGVYKESLKALREKVLSSYEEGKSVDELAVEFERSRAQILKVLREAGRGHTQRKYEGMLERYQGGESVAELASSYGVSLSAVYTYLNKCGVEFRRGRHALSKWESSEGSRLAEMYEGGMTLREVGEEFGISGERVRQILSGLEVSTRSRKVGELEGLEEMASRGMRLKEIAEEFGISDSAVSKRLRKRGLKVAYVPRVSWDWRSAEKDYLEGVLSLPLIAEKYGIYSYNAIVDVMDRLGHPRRGKFKDLDVESMRSDLESGLTQAEIANKYEVSPATVASRLGPMRSVLNCDLVLAQLEEGVEFSISDVSVEGLSPLQIRRGVLVLLKRGSLVRVRRGFYRLV